MSGPSWEEMEAKRQEMIASFRDLAAVMTRCVSIIEDYARLSPSTLGTTATSYPLIPNLSASELTALAQAMPSSLAEAPLALNGLSDTKKERKKREKKPKDPNAPKRPPSAYILFQNEVRDALRSSQPQLTYREVLDHIAERWKHLTDAQKKVYQDKYNAAIEVYRLEEQKYNHPGGAVPSFGVTVPVAAAAPLESDEESSDDSDDSDDSEPTPPAKTKVAKPVPAAPTAAAIATPAPASSKKEKKRKSKEEEGAVATMLDPTSDKKKKKKAKE